MPEQIRYAAPPTLARMLRSDAFARVAKGPVGSGKSSACVIEILRRASQQEPDSAGVRRTKWAIIRNTYRELRDTTRRTFEQWIPRQIGKWREADFAFDIKVPLEDKTSVECEVLFRSLNRPEDIKKLLSLEITGAYVNELREIRKEVIDILETRIGRFPSQVDGGPSWRGWWADTNPWAIGQPWQKFFRQPPAGYELYPQPSALGPDAENIGHLDPGYYDRLQNGKDAEWIRVYLGGEDAASDVGSIYGALLERYQTEVFDAPRDGVFASYDLGFTDSTAIWFWRVNGLGGLDFVDHYENHGQPLSHYFDEVEKRAWKIVKHWLPHDAAAHTLATGSSVEDQFRQRHPGRVQIGPSLSLLDGIQAGRWLLENPCRFHSRTAEGIEALRSYHYEWDDDTKTYSKKPEHDWSSHCFAGETEVLTRYGTCRMMDLPAVGEVLTPCGWKPYRSPRMSKRNAPLVEVAFEDGNTLRCTPGHLFLTASGWRSAEDLLPTTPIQSALTLSRSISMAASIAYGRVSNIIREAVSVCIGMLGFVPSARFRLAATSITAMGIGETIGSVTWSACPPRNTLRTRGLTSEPTLRQGCEPRLPNGTGLRSEDFGIAGKPSAPSLGRNGNANQNRALGVALRSWRWFARAVQAKNTAPKFARPLRIAGVKHLAETADVWDLTVPDGEWFSLANGAVVHNSADAFRYAAIVAKFVMRISRKALPPPEPIVPPIDKSFTLDQLWALHGELKGGRERI